MSQAHDGVVLGAHVDAPAGSPSAVRLAERDHLAVRAQLSDYLDGGLAISEVERVSRHLDSCADCTAYLATLRRTVTLLGELPTPSAPARARDATIQRALAES